MTFDERYACTEPLLHAEIGTLWRAEDRSLRRPVAVALLDDASAAERFLATAQTLSSQPNAVVRALEHGTRPDGVAFFVIEPPPGAALAERLSRSPQLLVEDVVRVALEVLSELEGVHAVGVAHGHIDPWTVWAAMHGKQLVGRLVGLGLYRASVDGRSARDVAYAAPELLRDGTFGPQCDVWSLGVLLHECLTGVHPFARASVDATRAAVLAGEAPSLAKLAPELPPALAAAIAKAMAPDPSVRFEDAKTMRRAIFVAMLTAGKRARAAVPTFQAGEVAAAVVAVPALAAPAPAPAPAAPAAPAPAPAAAAAAAPARPDASGAAPAPPRGRFPKSTIVGFAPAVEPVPLPAGVEPARPDHARLGSWLGLEKAEAQPPAEPSARANPAREAQAQELPPLGEPAMRAPLPPADLEVAESPSPPADVAVHEAPLPAQAAAEDLLLSLPPDAADDDLLLSLPPEAAGDELLLSLPPEVTAREPSPQAPPSSVADAATAEAHVFGRPRDRALPPPARLPRAVGRDWQSAPPPTEPTSEGGAPVVVAQAEPAPPDHVEVGRLAATSPALARPAPADIGMPEVARPVRAEIDAAELAPPKSRGWVWATLALAAIAAAGGGYWWYATQSGGASPPAAPPHASAPEPAAPELAAPPTAPPQPEPAAAAPPGEPAAPAAVAAPGELGAPGEPVAPAAVAAPGEPAPPEPVAAAPATEPAAPTVAVAEPVEPPSAARRTKVQRRVRRQRGAARNQPRQAPGLVGNPGF